ncbi:L-ascorbate oxidase [Metarhizium album ARSEF 1941]|uniref:Laccase 1 n=1 Tax=Metarhizium album (strain ARSEF 1941) TaxID=1081103 RepID=A0A0B2X3Z7_METAS|nr:L-ascorbate oxidase [Metarhizium album ARSEF 1941]KHO00150.1 L-ascorbate oxidase [Metarhizium album ARSEF 1941]
MSPAEDGEVGENAEEQPFLVQETSRDEGEVEAGASPAATTASSTPLSESSQTAWLGKSRASRQHRCCKLSLFLLFSFVTILGLCGIMLRFPPRGTRGSLDVHPHDDQEKNHQDDPAKGQTDDPEHHTILHYPEDVPRTPRLRDISEYVLPPSWNRSAARVTREYYWTISDAELNPDGVYRPMMLINSQFPGPLVECNEGDTIVVNVENKAVNATSIHFHGLFQNGTNWMDGTVGVTQCPIAPNSNYTYKFVVRGQSGTYWYHAHHSAQASDGLVGPVVIHSQDELGLQEVKYVTDRVIMVQDHYHSTTAELLMYYLQPDQENNEPVPDNALINGRGVRSCDDFKGWHCDNSNTSNPIFDLTANQRHRLRFINVGAFAEFQIQIDEHPFYITEVDGTDVHPEPFHRLNILPAQRYSVIVDTNVTTADAYWLRARMVTHCFATQNGRLQPEVRGIIRYISSVSQPLTADPQSKDWPEVIETMCRDLNTSVLHPVQHMNPPPADDFVTLRANFMIGAWRLARGFFNDSTWHANVTHPSLHRFLDAKPESTSLEAPLAINNKVFDKDNDFVLQTKGIRTVDISINNFDDGAHPFHLHGHKFFIIAQARSGYPPTAATLDKYLQHNGMPENPLRRDTVTVEAYSWAIVRVVLDNPGIWTLHCHNTWHSESGMVMQLLVQSEVVRRWTVDPQRRAMCELEGVMSGIRPDDSIWFGSF